MNTTWNTTPPKETNEASMTDPKELPDKECRTIFLKKFSEPQQIIKTTK